MEVFTRNHQLNLKIIITIRLKSLNARTREFEKYLGSDHLLDTSKLYENCLYRALILDKGLYLCIEKIKIFVLKTSRIDLLPWTLNVFQYRIWVETEF